MARRGRHPHRLRPGGVGLRWRPVTGLALAATLACLCGCSHRPRGPDLVWRAAWGGPGATTATGADGRLYGPQAFAAGGRQVWLADTYGRRLLSLPRGPVVNLGERGPLVGQLALMPQGGLLFAELDGGRLWWLN